MWHLVNLSHKNKSVEKSTWTNNGKPSWIPSMKNQFNWDDVPSMEGLSVDWNFKPISPLGKRAFVRIIKQDIPRIFSVDNIFVKVATVTQTYTGQLLDISKGGLSMILPVLLEQNTLLRVGFFLGPVKITSKAVVKHSRNIETQHITGIEFIDLDSESAGYINGLYASLILHHSL